MGGDRREEERHEARVSLATPAIFFALSLAVVLLRSRSWLAIAGLILSGLMLAVALWQRLAGDESDDEDEEDDAGRRRIASSFRRGFEKRAKRTGQLPDAEAARSLGLDREKLGKIRNGLAGEFAVNLDARLSDLARTDAPLTGQDDFGAPVTALPLEAGEHQVDLDQLMFWARIQSDGAEMPLRAFLEKVASAVRASYARPAREEFDPASMPFETLRVRRIAKLTGEPWFVLFESDAEPAPAR